MAKKGRRYKRQKVEEEKRKNEDRISELPETIIHRIFSYLGAKDVARTCVLSKAWRRFFSTFPVLDLDLNFYNFCEAHGFRCFHDGSKRASTYREYPVGSRRSFKKHFDDSIWSWITQHLDVTKVRLSVDGFDPEALSLSLDGSLNVLIKHKRVKELDLRLVYSTPYSYFKPQKDNTMNRYQNAIKYHGKSYELYTVPQTIFLGKSLSVLRLGKGCRIEVENVAAGVKLGGLRKLVLTEIELDCEGKITESLFSGCPLMEHLELRDCNNLRSICIPPKLLGLHKVVLHDNRSLQHIEVQAPNLHTLDFSGKYRKKVKFVLGACKALRILSLEWITIEDEEFQDLISSKPGIEALSMYRINGLTSMDLSNHKLKRLRLGCCKGLVIVTVKTLIPLTLYYHAKSLKVERAPFKFASNLLLQEIHLKFRLGSHLDTRSIFQLFAEASESMQLHVVVSSWFRMIIHERPREVLIPPFSYFENENNYFDSNVFISSRKLGKLLDSQDIRRFDSISMISSKDSHTENLQVLNQTLRDKGFRYILGPKDELATLWETFLKSCSSSTLQYQISSLWVGTKTGAVYSPANGVGSSTSKVNMQPIKRSTRERNLPKYMNEYVAW